MNQETINKLKDYLKKDKFSTQEWQKRGLNPSSFEICEFMNNGINNCCELIIKESEQHIDKRAIKIILKRGLKSIDKNQLDTEEKEFVCDCFRELADIVSIEINKELNFWMYGFVLSSMMQFVQLIKGSEKIVETLSQNCTKCDAELNIYVTKKQDGIPDYAYEVVKCNNCKEFNLMDSGPNIYSARIGEFEPVERLRKDEYNYEQAKERLEQIKYWRK